ncbi:MAG: PilZ domain-containing protein [Gammaproteobacteria bacterium]
MAKITEKPEASFEQESEDSEFWNAPVLDEHLAHNKRNAVRYIRKDIDLSLRVSGFFNFKKPIPLTLIDVSSKGVLLATDKKFRLNKKITLEFLFNDNSKHTVEAVIVRRKFSEPLNFYGAKFRRINDELGEQLLKTQTDLNFS